MAINGNLSCVVIVIWLLDARRGRTGDAPVCPTPGLRGSAAHRCGATPGQDSGGFPPRARGEWRPGGGLVHPRTPRWCGGLQIQDREKDSIGEFWTRCGRPSPPGSRGWHAGPASGVATESPWGTGMPSWPCPRAQACAPHLGGELLPVLTHGRQYGLCRVKGKFCTMNVRP